MSSSNPWTAFEHAAKQAGIASDGNNDTAELVRQLYDRLRTSPAFLFKPDWNAFQAGVAKMGLSKQQVSSLYRASKGIQFAATPPAAAAVAAAELPSASSSSKLAAVVERAASPAAPAASPKTNAWNAFERAALQAGIASDGNVRQLYDRLVASPAFLLKPDWNAFQATIKGLGLTKQEVSALYHATKGIQFAAAAVEEEDSESSCN